MVQSCGTAGSCARCPLRPAVQGRGLGRAIGGALVGPFLGVFLAYGIVGPFATRVKIALDASSSPRGFAT